MTLSTLAGLQSALPGRHFPFYKGSSSALDPSTTQMHWPSYWLASGSPGVASTPPSGAGEVPTKDTTGALSIINPASGNTLYVARFKAVQGLGASSRSSAFPKSIIALFDRLVHTSGLSGTSTSSQTVNSASVNRPDSNGADAMLFLEVYTAVGLTNATATVSYTNQSGTSGQSGTAQIGGAPGSNGIGCLIPVQLAAGDTGVRSVQSVTLSVSTGTAGNFGITIARRIASNSQDSGDQSYATKDPFDEGLAQIPASACLFFVGRGLGGAPITGDLTTVEG